MSLIRPALVLFILLTLLTGGVYPLLTTSLGQWWFNPQANGSLIRLNGEVRGSADWPELHRRRLFPGPPVGHRGDGG